MRMLWVLVLMAAGCAVVPNSPPPQNPPPLVAQKFETRTPPLPALARTFALSATFTADPPPVYVSPVPTNAPGYATITPVVDGVLIQWANWPTNSPYRIEVSTTLTNWKEFASGTSSSNSNVIGIMDRSLEDFPAFFYRIVAP